MDAPENSDMFVPKGANEQAELKKRRTTRIVQAVPLQVTGIDALGRPFQERTSTLIINCHGCRFQSKHYVLKNMWVNLEIPNPEPDRPPRTVRGKIIWIQRPRTVRQLFQVAVELEIPGNIWGIAFPPEDWFPFPESQPGAAETLPNTPEFTTPLLAAFEDQEPQIVSNNLHVVPPATHTDASLQLGRQVARLMAEARQQIQSAAHEAAMEAVAAEAKPALASVQAQIAAARHEIESAVSSSLDRAAQEAASRIREAKEAAAAALREELPRWLTSQTEELTREMASQLAEAASTQFADTGRHLDELRLKAEESAERLESRLQGFEQELPARAESSRQEWEQITRSHMAEASSSQREAMLAAAAEVRQQITSSLAAADAAWHRRLQSDLESASGRLQQSMEYAVAAAAQCAAQEIEACRKDSLSQLDAEISSRAASFTASLSSARETLDSLSQLPAALAAERVRAESISAEAAQAAQRLEQLSTRLEGLRQDALREIDFQFSGLLETQTVELRRRSEALLKDFSTHVEQALDVAGQANVAGAQEKLAAALAPHLARAEELAASLERAGAESASVLEAQRARLRDAAEEFISASLARVREAHDAVEKEAEGRAKDLVARSLSDLDARATDIQHTTVESLYKSAEWYEKKLQMQMQNALEKGLEQAGGSLREKAGEISAVFASELDNHSRNFVDHAQGQIDEVVKDAFERAHALFTEAAETTTAAFTDEIQRNARQELDGFEGFLRKSLEAARAEASGDVEALRARLASERHGAETQFQSGITAAVESGVAEVHKQIEASFGPLLESWRSMTEAHQARLRDLYGRLGDESVEQYRQRLENVSNSWMLAAVTSLDHQSREVLDNIALSAEEKLRETCAQVFAQAGDVLRARLQEISSAFFVHTASSSQK